MGSPIDKLRKWLLDRYEEFGSSAVNPNKIDDIINLVQSNLGFKLIEYVGEGDNGIVFKTDNGDVAKFTIDAGEAALWARLKGKRQLGMPVLKNVIQLVSSKSPDNYIYVIVTDFIPHELPPDKSRLVSYAIKRAKDLTRSIIGRRVNMSKRAYWATRTRNLVKMLYRLAQQDNSFRYIPEMIMSLADIYGAFIYDLHSDNFRITDNGIVVLVDPSVPDLLGGGSKPNKLTYESIISILNSVDVIIG